MVSPDDQFATHPDSCPDETRSPRRVILPWRTQSSEPPSCPSRALAWKDARDGLAGIGAAGGDGSGFLPLPIDKIKQVLQSNLQVREREAEPKLLSPAELHRLYVGTSVPPHRYFAPLLHAAANSPEIAMDPARWLAGVADVNISAVVNDWLQTNRSTEYEQLSCIGLDPCASCLTGILTVKQGHGYCGGPATAGSREFVAFWVDWGAGFQYEGTTSVVVHDFGALPPAGLEYCVFLPIDLLSRVQSCGESNGKVKVMAVLSWNVPPSTIYPHSPVVWGNRVESLIQLPNSDKLLADGQGSGFNVADLMEINLSRAGGWIIAAAIRSLAEMTFGADAGLSVVPDRTPICTNTDERRASIHVASSEESSCPFTLYAWDRTKVNRGAAPNSKIATAGLAGISQAENIDEPPPEAGGIRFPKRVPPVPQKNGVTLK